MPTKWQCTAINEMTFCIFTIFTSLSISKTLMKCAMAKPFSSPWQSPLVDMVSTDLELIDVL